MATRQVLVVEDEELVAMMLADMLMELNYGVLGPVGELTSALALAQEAAPDAALLDVSLHGVASFPLAEALQVKGIPFAFMTGYGERDFPPAFRQIPRLSKPFDLPELRRVLGGLLPRE
ncbi:MAG TPA: response regulator [Dongiaceae bacterium]|jgi:CheY-like chemotaxis protein|nr:response regulator [Dongiaceae bacterium]